LAWLVKAVKEIDAGVPPPGSPGCCYERVSQCLDLCGLRGQHALGGTAVGRSDVEIMYESVAGIDVHKKQITVAVRTPGGDADGISRYAVTRRSSPRCAGR